MRNFIKAVLVVSFLVPAVSFAGDAPKATAAKTDAKAPAKVDAKAPAKVDAKTPAKVDAKKPAAKPTK
ncbi:MAG: hypothetical protein ABI591_06635 [Kofleriaceae bacterium]